MVPADIRILESTKLKVDKSNLTGEFEPIIVVSECTNPENPLDSQNLVFCGTYCKEGEGKGLVFATGDATVIGEIAKLTLHSEESPSYLKKGIDRIVFIIFIITISIGVIMFACGFIIELPIFQNIVFVAGMVAALIPEGLLPMVTLSLAITQHRLALKNVFVKNMEAVESLGSTSCICTDNRGILTANNFTTESL